MRPILIIGMQGIGDCIYQRCFVRAEAEQREVYLLTPWPEFYHDLDVKFIRPGERYRTQSKNVARQPPSRWHRFLPRDRDNKGYFYLLRHPLDNPIREFERITPLPNGRLQFDLPPMGPSPVKTRRRLAVIRPVVVRREWINQARNPDATHIAQTARWLRRHKWHVVTVADVDPPVESFVGEIPEADERFEHGELDIRALMALVQNADLVVGGVGWVVPAAIAAQVPLIVIGGGMGGHNAPEKLTDPRMDLSRVRWLLPDPYCRACTNRKHPCNKTIPDFEQQFARAVSHVTGRRLAA